MRRKMPESWRGPLERLRDYALKHPIPFEEMRRIQSNPVLCAGNREQYNCRLGVSRVVFSFEQHGEHQGYSRHASVSVDRRYPVLDSAGYWTEVLRVLGFVSTEQILTFREKFKDTFALNFIQHVYPNETDRPGDPLPFMITSWKHVVE